MSSGNSKTKISMPQISNFFGIIIKMFYDEHNPPHFHAIYGEFMGAITIETLEMIEGDLPQKALSLAKEWAEEHKHALINIWKTQQFVKLPPLE